MENENNNQNALVSDESANNDYSAKKEVKNSEAQRQAGRRNRRKFTKGLVFLMILILIGWGVYKLGSRENPDVGEFFPAQSRDHIAVGVAHDAYNTNPPTGGWHYAQPVQTGIYDQELPDEQIVHNLEHGHIWFAHRPDLSAEQIEILADIAKGYGSRVIMTPRVANDSPIAIVAWERLVKMDQVNKELVEDFVDAYRNMGPEKNIPDFGFGDFRKKD
ncbi:MAG: DUF3105 domain-containing protein [bacterium]|nr:DUF3105 domain-containing protein [bacterium]